MQINFSNSLKNLGRFTASNVAGTASMLARVDLGNGLTRDIPLASEQSFTGNSVSTQGILRTSELGDLLTLSQATGYSDFGAVTVTIIPTVSAKGALDHHPVAVTFQPHLVFSFNNKALILAPTPNAIGKTGSATQVGGLQPSKSEQFASDQRADNTVPLLIVHPTVLQARIIGLASAAVLLALTLWLGWPFYRANAGEETPDDIQLLYGTRLVPVRSLSVPAEVIVEVANMAALAQLAKRYDSVVMHLDDGSDSYLVWDNGLLYRYRAGTAPATVATT